MKWWSGLVKRIRESDNRATLKSLFIRNGASFVTWGGSVMVGWVGRRLAWLWGSWFRRFWACNMPAERRTCQVSFKSETSFTTKYNRTTETLLACPYSAGPAVSVRWWPEQAAVVWQLGGQAAPKQTEADWDSVAVAAVTNIYIYETWKKLHPCGSLVCQTHDNRNICNMSIMPMYYFTI